MSYIIFNLYSKYSRKIERYSSCITTAGVHSSRSSAGRWTLQIMVRVLTAAR